MAVFSGKRWRSYTVLALLTALVVVIVHFWIVDRRVLQRLIYPAEAVLAHPVLTCSSGAPQWLAAGLRYALWNNNSLSGQMSYVAPSGEVHDCALGWRGAPLLSDRVSDTSRFRYASMTKLLTADITLRQVERGHLSLATPLLDVLPDMGSVIDERLKSITVEHLLRHSAGFDRLKTPDPMVMHRRQPWCPYDVSQLAGVRLDFAPGEGYGYSNLNYCLLAVVLERVTERPFRDLLEQEYGLEARGIRFLDGPYLPDEVRYDFRNSHFYGINYHQYFDFMALSSSAGLSGSAAAFARLVDEVAGKEGFAVTHAPISPECRLYVVRDCFGYSVFPYRLEDHGMLAHVQTGFLYGAPSMTMLDDRGGVLVWVASGMNPSGDSADPMIPVLYRQLAEYYRRGE